jgi:type I restriction enzyme R subunit
MAKLIESDVESVALGWLESLGWEVKAGAEIAPGGLFAERADYREVMLSRRLREALARLNPDLPDEALEEAFRRITSPLGSTLDQLNRDAHRMLTNGVTVEYRRSNGSIAGAQVQVVDFDNPGNNDWLAVNQFTASESRTTRRIDVVLFVNGLPLAIIELKNPTDEQATIWSAYQQLQTYKHEIPSLFAYNEALEINDSAVKVLGEPTLRQIAQELVRTVRENVSIDWAVRENVRANLRRLVKRILRKYGYPPDKQEKATETMLEQAELLSAEWAAA